MELTLQYIKSILKHWSVYCSLENWFCPNRILS